MFGSRGQGVDVSMTTLIFDCDGVLADTERDGHRPAFNQTFAEFGLPRRLDARRSTARSSRSAAARSAWRACSRRSSCARTACRRMIEAARLLAAAAPAQDRALHRAGARRPTSGTPGHPRGSSMPRPAPAGRSSSPRPRPRSRCAPCSSTPSARRSPRASRCSPATSSPARSRIPRSTCWRWSAPTRAPADSIVVEDSRNGLLAAARAGLRCVVTVNGYTADEDMSEAVLVVSSLGDPGEPTRGAREPQPGAAAASWSRWLTSSLSGPHPLPRRLHE